MCPNATLDIILDPQEDREARLEAIDNLIGWLESGGFLPRLHGKVAAPSFGGNTAARRWLIAHLEQQKDLIGSGMVVSS